MSGNAGSLPGLSVAVLGPLELRIDGELVEVPGTRRRALLALLALARGRVVSTDALIDAVWNEEPPETARQALQSHISRLRRSLGPYAARLEHRGEGYRLDLPEDGLDVAVARRAVRDGDGNGEALAAFRGEPLAEFADYPALAAEAVGLSEMRADLRDAWLESRLAAAAQGEPDPSLVVDAAAVAAADPLRERTALVWISALATMGRTAEAMQAAAVYRRRLAEETGLDPGPLLGRLEHEVASGALQPRSGTERRLVRPPTPFFGRERDRDEMHRLLDGYRCVTLTGPGGVGKTRLTVEVAADRAERGPVPVAWVALAAVADAARVPEALVSVLRLRVEQPSARAVADALDGRDLLLVLDNCEHVLAASRELVHAIQERAPGVSVLATSRTSLQVPGEYVLRLQPLPVPVRPAVDDLARQPAVRAFIEYAERRRHGALVLTTETAGLLVDVLRRLDGLPLAIELAAGQLATVPIEALHERLGRALDALSAERPEETARHRTLRATIDWSYRLLGDSARALLRSLAPFGGGVALDTVEQLTDALGLGEDPVALLNELVDGSLLGIDPQRAARYTLLETVRAFLLDELTTHGERTTAESRFIAWAQREALDLGRDLIAPDEHPGDLRLRAEMANLGAARALALQRGELDLPVTISWAMIEGTQLRDLPEIWNWTRELAADPRLRGHPMESAVLGAAAVSSWLLGDGKEATRLAHEGLALAPHDRRTAASCHNALGAVALFAGDFGLACVSFERAADCSANPGSHLAAAVLAAGYAGREAQAAELLARSRSEGRRIPTQTGRAFTDYAAAEVARDADEAASLYRAAIDSARTAGLHFVEGVSLVGLATLLAEQRETGRAAEIYLQLLDYWHRTGNLTQLWTTVRNAATLLVDAGDLESATVLFGAADGARAASVVSGDPGQRILEAAARTEVIDSDRHRALSRRGARSSTAEVLAEARSALEKVRSRRLEVRR